MTTETKPPFPINEYRNIIVKPKRGDIVTYQKKDGNLIKPVVVIKLKRKVPKAVVKDLLNDKTEEVLIADLFYLGSVNNFRNYKIGDKVKTQIVGKEGIIKSEGIVKAWTPNYMVKVLVGNDTYPRSFALEDLTPNR